MNKYHVPVLVNEVVEHIRLKSHNTYVDCTVGGGGHSLAMLEQNPKIKLYCFDQDEAAIRQSQKTLCNYIKQNQDNIKLFRENFRGFRNRLALNKVSKVDGILMDIGVSNHQLTEPKRGFSFMSDAKLDMRMDRSKDFSAFEVINEYKADALENIFFRYGEEKFTKRIVANIIKHRESSTIYTTKELAEIIEKSVPKSYKININKIKARIFQAIRIEVNQELEVLSQTLSDAISTLKSGGRLLVISWHSLEDRIVKETFKSELGLCTCPPEIRQCICNAKARIKLITKKPIEPTEEEILANSNARSAKLRVAERI